MKKTQQIFKEGCGVELIQEDITRVVHHGKHSETRSRPLSMSIRSIDKKKRVVAKFSQTEKLARKGLCES